MAYVDGFVIAVPKERMHDYERIARQAGEVWKEYGALGYVEAVADDVPYGELTSFPRAVQATDEETVVFSYILYRDRAHRDEVNAKVMADPRITGVMDKMPFDTKRMIWGGFGVFLEM